MALAHRTWADGAAVGYAFSPDRISIALRDDVSVPRVLVADPYRSPLSRLVRRRPTPPPFSRDPSRRLVHPYRWRRGEPTTRDEAVPVHQRLDRWLQARIDPADSVLVTSNPVLAAVADRRAWQDVTYYAWDDFRGIPGMRDLFDWAHAEVAANDVNLVAVTERITQVVGAPRSTVVPNGILASDYDDLPAVPEWFAALPGRVALYAGSLQSRIDVDLLLDLVRSWGPEWTLVMVGPLQDPAWIAPIAAEPNVVVHDAEPRPQVLAMMAAADVCLVPHVVGTEDMSPLKVYEYLGAGTPVVAIDLAPMRDLSPRCLLVPPGESWTDAFHRAAALPPADPADVRAFRAQHDWGARYLAFRKATLGR